MCKMEIKVLYSDSPKMNNFIDNINYQSAKKKIFEDYNKNYLKREESLPDWNPSSSNRNFLMIHSKNVKYLNQQ